jgi:hypothetical protein
MTFGVLAANRSTGSAELGNDALVNAFGAQKRWLGRIRQLYRRHDLN